MTLFTKLFAVGFAIISLASCSSNTSTPTPNPDPNATRGKVFEEVSFMGKMVKLDVVADKIDIKKRAADAEQDAAIIANIYGNLNVAKNQQALAVEFSASDEAVTNGMFIFSVKAQEDKELTMKMYDEEGFELANNTINLHNGENYKALNVTQLESGTYAFRLLDEEGKELNRKVTIANK